MKMAKLGCSGELLFIRDGKLVRSDIPPDVADLEVVFQVCADEQIKRWKDLQGELKGSKDYWVADMLAIWTSGNFTKEETIDFLEQAIRDMGSDVKSKGAREALFLFVGDKLVFKAEDGKWCGEFQFFLFGVN